MVAGIGNGTNRWPGGFVEHLKLKTEWLPILVKCD